MSIKKAPRINRNDDAVEYIHKRHPFRNGNGSFSARVYRIGDLIELGDLDEQGQYELSRFQGDNGFVYVVYSYSTPIAWGSPAVSPLGAVDMLIVPPVQYSPTTTQHQYIVLGSQGVHGYFSTKDRHGNAGPGKSSYGTRKGQ